MPSKKWLARIKAESPEKYRAFRNKVNQRHHKIPVGKKNKSQKERRGGIGFWSLIAQGKVDTANLEVACKVCNTLHYLRYHFGETGHKITWSPPQ